MFVIRRLFGATAAIGALAVLFSVAGGLAQQPGGLKIPSQPPPAPAPAVLANYAPVTADRLKKPDDCDWLMIRRTYDGWGYSPLSQITPANVKRLAPVWVMSTGMNNGH